MSKWNERHGLKGKRALVTGATKGIGFETCKVLADAGADIVAVGRDKAGLAEVKAAVESFGRRCLAVEADMGTVEGPKRAAAEALAAFGTIDILVNNAGIARNAALLDITLEQWDDTLNVNLRAPMLLAQDAGAQHDQAEDGKDHQYLVPIRRCGTAGPRGLWCVEGWPQHVDAGDDRRMGQAQHPVQHRVPDGHPDADGRNGLGPA